MIESKNRKEHILNLEMLMGEIKRKNIVQI